MTSILFLCLGNICRSPLAEGTFRHLAQRAGVLGRFQIDSAGNGAWHQRNPPNPNAVKVARENGIDISDLRSRPMVSDDLDAFDLILAMDRGNIENLDAAFPQGGRAEVRLYLDYIHGTKADVPDPYYGDMNDYVDTFQTVYTANQKLLAKLK